VASLAETASFEGTEEVGEGSAFVRLFEELAWLLASQSKESKASNQAQGLKVPFLVMAKIPPLTYRTILTILNQR
jgi:hypothetical protein